MGDNPVFHKQEDLYKIPSDLILEILMSMTDKRNGVGGGMET